MAAVTSVLVLGLFTGLAYGAISNIEPASGTVSIEPGESSPPVSVSVDSGGLVTTSCLEASSSDPVNVTVALDGVSFLATTCGSDSWTAIMTISAASTTEPGDYVVTLRELTLGGTLLGTQTWVINVVAPPGTDVVSTETLTTTTLPTITLPTSSSTTSTSLPGTSGTTTTSAPRAESTSTTVPVSGGGSDGSPGPPEGGSGDGPAESIATGIDRMAAGESAIGAYGAAPFPTIAMSAHLLDLMNRALPPAVGQAVVALVVIAEVLARAVEDLLLPIAFVILFGALLIWRMKPQDEDIEYVLFLEEAG
jgi:hypothetical protein